MEGVGPLSISLRGVSGCLYFCIISAVTFVLDVELIMLRMMMGRFLSLILLSSVVRFITAGMYKWNERMKLFLEMNGCQIVI